MGDIIRCRNTRQVTILIGLILKLFIYISIQSPVIRLDTPALDPNSQFTQNIIYQNGVYNNQFLYTSELFNCSQCTLFTYEQSPQNLIDNAPCFLYLYNFTSYPTIKYDTFYSLFQPKIDDQQCDEVLSSATTANPQSCMLKIISNCPNPVGLFNYFDTIQIQIEGFESITYNLICDSSYRTNTFQAGTMLLILIVTIMITILAVYSSSAGLKNNRISINLIVIGVLLSILILFQIFSFINELESVLRIFMKVLNFMFGIPGVSYCINEVLYFCRNPFFLFGVKVFNKFTLRVVHIISIILSIGIMLAWILLYQNWIINDVICVCMIIMLVRIFKFDSLKVAVLYVVLIIAIGVTDIVVAKLRNAQAGQSFFINHVNNAFQLQLPTINPVFNQKCSWLNMFQIAYPGMLLSYLRRFDKSRNTKLYLILSLIIFVIGSFLWTILTFVGQGIVLPFGIISDPLTFIAISILARQRKQFKNIWNGTFYDQQFMDKEARKTIEMALKQTQQNQTRLNDNLLAGLAIQIIDKNNIQNSGISSIPQQYQEESQRKQSHSQRHANINLNQSIGPLNSSIQDSANSSPTKKYT